MGKLWETYQKMHPMVNQYIIDVNLAQDKILLPYDIQASIAHVEMLAKVKLLTKKEAESLIKGLKEVLTLNKKGKFKLKQINEDCHTAIENYLTKKLGAVGKKVHMGRSRNDQILVAIRLFSKHQLKIIQLATIKLAKTILKFAKKHEFLPIPGYTHMQQAMPSSVGQWAGSFVESLLDDYQTISSAYNLNDQNPLGSAAGFGTSLPIDREYTTKKLGFAKIQINSLYCQNSRGKIESFTIGVLNQTMLTLGKIANDLILFTTKEFNFFKVNDQLTTGSSIMPQKKNLDIMEVLRANVSVVAGEQFKVQSVSQNLISGYNKDLKITKKALIDSFDIVLSSINITELLFNHLKPNTKQLQAAFDPEIFATDMVNDMVKNGTPFRDAYRQVALKLKGIKKQNVVKNIKSKTHLGATGNLGLKILEKKISKFRISDSLFVIPTSMEGSLALSVDRRDFSTGSK